MNHTTQASYSEIQRFYGASARNEWRIFLSRFDLADGFALHALLLPSPAGAAVCEQSLADHLRGMGKQLLPLRATDEAALARLPEQLLNLRPEPGVGGLWIEWLAPDSQTFDRWEKACAQTLASLNQQRDRLQREQLLPVIMVGGPWLQTTLREAAPDLWSIRIKAVRLEPEAPLESPGALPSGNREITLAGDDEAAADPGYVLQQANKFRHHPELNPSRADLLLRAGKGFYLQGWPEMAEVALLEAGQIFQDLAKLGPGQFLPEIARARGNLAIALSALGRREEALAQAVEEVKLRVQLAQERPGVFRPGLAGSLNNLAICLSALGRLEEAVTKAEETVRVYSQLAQGRPGEFLPEWARARNNLATLLSKLGRHEEALAQASEAVGIRKQLAHKRPETHLPELAGALNNQAMMLTDLGRREEALAQTEEAVRIYVQLAQAPAEGYRPNLAQAYGMKGRILSGLERYQEAAAAFAEGIRALADHFQKLPQPFADIMGYLCKGYLDACAKASAEPDMELLAPVIQTFKQLEPAAAK
jgi:tetratricopeptide (TPR) repeat protein